MTDQVKYTHKLKGDKVLVIGGSSGIGYATAEALIEHGSQVIISSSNESRVKQKVEQMQKSYPSASSRISGYACNLGDAATLEPNILGLLEHSGKVDHIVFTAGDALAMRPIDKIEVAQAQQAGVVRFLAPIVLAKHAPKYLNTGPKSSITLTTGAVSERPIPGWSVINAYATGLQGLVRGLAVDLKPIRVNLVSPGIVKTELWSTSGMDKETQEKTFKESAAKLPTGVAPGPEEIAEAYVYLLRDYNITGTMISTNGGTLLMGN